MIVLEIIIVLFVLHEMNESRKAGKRLENAMNAGLKASERAMRELRNEL